jgi:hypothetical protein
MSIRMYVAPLIMNQGSFTRQIKDCLWFINFGNYGIRSISFIMDGKSRIAYEIPRINRGLF